MQELHIFQRRCRRISTVYNLFIHFARETFRETFFNFSISISIGTIGLKNLTENKENSKKQA